MYFDSKAFIQGQFYLFETFKSSHKRIWIFFLSEKRILNFSWWKEDFILFVFSGKKTFEKNFSVLQTEPIFLIL